MRAYSNISAPPLRLRQLRSQQDQPPLMQVDRRLEYVGKVTGSQLPDQPRTLRLAQHLMQQLLQLIFLRRDIEDMVQLVDKGQMLLHIQLRVLLPLPAHFMGATGQIGHLSGG